MSADAETIAVYDAKAEEFEAFVKKDGESPRLSAFIAGLPERETVLDLGCGTGSAAAAMRDAGLKVTALDASAEMVALAKQRFDLNVRLGTFDDLSGEDRFGGVWASFSLLHAPRKDMPRHLAAIHRALKAGGLLFIGLKTGRGEMRDTLGRSYTYYCETELLGLLEAAGFTPTHTETGESEGLDGIVSGWITVDCHG